MINHHQQLILEAVQQGKSIVINARAGAGKAQPLTEPILTPQGWATMGDINVGDSIVGIDGKPYPVVATHPQGELDVYRVDFTDGSYTRCNSKHLWTVQTGHDRAMTKRKGSFVSRTLALEDIYKDYLPASKGRGYKYHVPSLLAPVAQGVDIEEAYLEGYVLGNAFVGGDVLTITSPDGSFLNHTMCLPTGYYQAKGSRQYRFSWHVLPANISRYRGTMLSGDKRFLSEILDYSPTSRLNLLRGLVDSDGTNQNQDGRDRLSFSSTSINLLHLVRDLVRSLGGRACEPTWDNRDKYKSGVCGKVAFRLPFSASHRANKARGSIGTYSYNSAICKITSEGKEHQKCITVEAPLSLYVTRGFKLTHNSSTLAAISQATNKRMLVLAFNKHNALEIDGKIKGDCKTLHSLGMGILSRFAPLKINRNKIIPLAKQLNIPTSKRLSFEKFWNAYRLSGAYPNSASWQAIVQDFCEDNIESYYQMAEAVEEANMALWLNDGIIDFTDMLWIPARLPNLSPFPYDIVALDEAHDASPIALDLLQRGTSASTQIIVCLDPDQKINTSLAMLHYENLEESKDRWGCEEFTLPISYRCPSEVVAEANIYVPEIKAFRTGGKVVAINDLPNDLPKGSLVLSGHYKHLIPSFITRRLNGEKVALRGHNYIEECLKEAKKCCKTPYKMQFSDVVDLCGFSLNEKIKKCAFTLAGLDEKKRLLAINDTLIEMGGKFNTLKEAEKFAGDATKQSGADAIYSTIHRCKGDEAENVYFLSYNEYHELSLAGDKEINRLTYVGVTRSKENLYLVC